MPQLTELTVVTDLLLAHHNILCVSHVGPDGDAVGSLTAMGWLLLALNKQPTLALADRIPDNLRDIPGADRIIPADQVAADYDLIICLDASSPDRMGAVFRADDHGTIPLLVIDHHITNTQFGTVNWVAPDCAATCQMLVYLADALDVPLGGLLAESLLTGIVTDTLCFRTSNTDAAVLEAAMRLVQAGADLATITASTLNRHPFSTVRLWGAVLNHVRLDEQVIWVTISQAELAAAGANDDDIKLSSMLIATDEANVSATFVEKRNAEDAPVVECSFRAKPGFNVSTLAYELGGGGHPPASGCTLPGTLQTVTEQVIPMLKAAARPDGDRP